CYAPGRVTSKVPLRLGSMVRYSQAQRETEVTTGAPLLADAIRYVGHSAIRNRGTVCGSLAHADPAAEAPRVALALDAELVAASTRGRRTIAAGEFFVGPFMTALEDDE